MHDCEEFRQRIAEQIIDREDLADDPDVQRELRICRPCLDFYVDSREMIEALSAIDFGLPESECGAIEHRLRMRILSSRPPQRASQPRMFRSFRLAPVLAG